MEESSPTYMFNMHIEGHIQVKNNFKILYGVTGGQVNAIQSKHLETSALSLAECIIRGTRQTADMRRGAEMEPAKAAEYRSPMNVKLLNFWSSYSTHWPLHFCISLWHHFLSQRISPMSSF